MPQRDFPLGECLGQASRRRPDCKVLKRPLRRTHFIKHGQHRTFAAVQRAEFKQDRDSQKGGVGNGSVALGLSVQARTVCHPNGLLANEMAIFLELHKLAGEWGSGEPGQLHHLPS